MCMLLPGKPTRNKPKRKTKGKSVKGEKKGKTQRKARYQGTEKGEKIYLFLLQSTRTQAQEGKEQERSKRTVKHPRCG